MRPASLDEVARCVPLVSPEELAILVRGVLRLKPPVPNVALADRLRIVSWEWLLHLGFVPGDQRRTFLGRLDLHLGALAERLAAAHDGPVLKSERLPVFRVYLVEHRYLNVPGLETWHDIVFDEPVAELPVPPVTTILFDLTAAYCRFQERLVRLKGPLPATPPQGDTHARAEGDRDLARPEGRA